MATRVVEYTPAPTVSRFHASNAFVRGLRGPIGSGKSVGCCWEIYTRALEQAPGPDGVRRSRWLVTRNTYGELMTTTIKTWLDWFPEERVGRMVHGAPITQNCRFRHSDGTEVSLEMWFLALDRPDHIKKLLSLEVTGGWMNEAREQPKAILDALTGRVGRFPRAEEGGCTWSGVIMDTNPPDSDHWWYKLAEEGHHDGFQFWSQPPGDSEQAENLDWLLQTPDSMAHPVGSLERREQGERYYHRIRAGKSAEWIKVYVRGEYGFVLDGRPVFPEFVDSLHVGNVEFNPNLPLYVGIDFGLTPAATFANRTATGQWRIFDELVSEHLGAKRFGELLRAKLVGEYQVDPARVAGITGDPAGTAESQADESTPFEMLAVSGIIARPAHTNDPTLRREAFAAPMTRLIDGQPGLLVSPKCIVLRKALAGGYCFKRVLVSGEDRFRDKPDKNHFSHVAEAAEYMVLGAGEGRLLIRKHPSNSVRVPKYAIV